MKNIFILAAASLALVACDKEDNYIDELVAAQISAVIDNEGGTRASDTSWTSGDQIGVTMEGRYANIKYVTEDDTGGNFSGTPLYFKNKREPVILTAYYPFSGTEGMELEVIEAYTEAARQTPDEQAKFDFLFAKKENVTGQNPEVKFDFSHKMGKITLIFKNGSGAEVNKINSYTIEGLILKGAFDPVNGVCTAENVSDEPLGIDLTNVTLVSGESVDPLIVFPQIPDSNSLTLKITDSEDQEYSCKLKLGNDGIVSGNNYLFTITVNKTGLVVENSTIIDWDKKSVEAEADSVL